MSEDRPAGWVSLMSAEGQRAFLELTRAFLAKRQELSDQSELTARERDFLASPEALSVATYFESVRDHASHIAALQLEFGEIAEAMAAVLRREFDQAPRSGPADQP